MTLNHNRDRKAVKKNKWSKHHMVSVAEEPFSRSCYPNILIGI